MFQEETDVPPHRNPSAISTAKYGSTPSHPDRLNAIRLSATTRLRSIQMLLREWAQGPLLPAIRSPQRHSAPPA